MQLPENQACFGYRCLCGAPIGTGGEEILLGDVIISTGIIQYDFGRQLPDRFIRKDTLEDTAQDKLRLEFSRYGKSEVLRSAKTILFPAHSLPYLDALIILAYTQLSFSNSQGPHRGAKTTRSKAPKRPLPD